MSRLLGQPVHQCYVYPDFDAALKRFAAAGIGPFFVLGDETGGPSIFRGEEHPLRIKVAFVYTGNTCFEIITPIGEQQSTYSEFLSRNPSGGLHHIAYYSEDFDKTLAMLAREGAPFTVVQDLRQPGTDWSIEIYCEPDEVDNPVNYQFLRPGLFDSWFDAMREAAATWDGSDPIRDARPLMAAALGSAARETAE
jgi:catechol 2,3-dioxygenase-like lactoylglutathione lyase family enzyme